MTDSAADIQAWNPIADQYTQMIGTPEDRIYTLFKDVLWDSLGDLHGLTVLDVGCGHGWLTQAMLAAGAAVTGIDGSTELLHRAHSLCPQAEFVEWDLVAGLPPLERLCWLPLSSTRLFGQFWLKSHSVCRPCVPVSPL